LAFDVPTLQLIAYSALTCASVIVASVSGLLAFRQSIGWKPIVFPTSHGFGRLNDDEPDGLSKATLEFEVWNRRKYPIIVIGAQVDFETLDFVFTESLGRHGGEYHARLIRACHATLRSSPRNSSEAWAKMSAMWAPHRSSASFRSEKNSWRWYTAATPEIVPDWWFRILSAI
jgi:hypothetical protein